MNNGYTYNVTNNNHNEFNIKYNNNEYLFMKVKDVCNIINNIYIYIYIYKHK